MAITFETHGIPNNISEPDITPEQRDKISKRISKSNSNLQKKMKAITIKEAESIKKSKRRN